MTINQLAGLMVTLSVASIGFLKYYIDAKIDPLAKQVDTLVQYMVSHEGKIERLDERTQHLKKPNEK